MECWPGTVATGLTVESGVVSTQANPVYVRFSSTQLRGCDLEGATIQGGGNVAFVNDRGGICDRGGSQFTPTLPNAGIFLGSGVQQAAFVGGNNGWYFNANYADAETNESANSGHQQNYGLVLGAGMPVGSSWPYSNVTLYGFDLWGNVIAGVGLQTTGTNVVTIVPNAPIFTSSPPSTDGTGRLRVQLYLCRLGRAESNVQPHLGQSSARPHAFLHRPAIRNCHPSGHLHRRCYRLQWRRSLSHPKLHHHHRCGRWGY